MYSAEEQLIITASQVHLTSREQEMMVQIVREELDWGFLLYQCAHHRVIPLVWNHFQNLGLTRFMEKYVRYIFEHESARIAEHNAIVLTELKYVYQAFQENGIRAVLLKGALLAPTVYQNIGLREFHDVDFLIGQEELSKVTKVLAGLGYIQGHYDVSTNTITPASREEKMLHRMNTHELTEFLKPTGQSACKAVEIDVNFELAWKGHSNASNQYRLPAAEFIAQAEQVNSHEMNIYRLKPEHQLIQLCAHLYSEAVFFCFESRWLRDKFDLNLIKFCDINEFLKQQAIHWGELKNILESIPNAGVPVFYTLSLLNKLYPDRVPVDFLDDLNCRKDLLDIFYDRNGETRQWGTGFTERMFNITDKVGQALAMNII